LVYIDEQSRQAFALAKAVDSIQKYQTNIRTLEKKEQQTGELNFPTLPYNSQDDLAPSFDGKFHNQPNIDVISPNRSLHQTQNRVDKDELQALQNEANEALNKIETAKPVPDFDLVQTNIDTAHTIAYKFQDAFVRGDHSELSRMISDDLTIKLNSNDVFEGKDFAVTQLQIVKGGGSYLLIHCNEKYWVVPTFNTLTSFTISQFAKGLFIYEPETIPSAQLRQPAEVKEVSGVWEVVTMGVVAVPIKA
jgi:hypothetical protein